MRSPRGAVAWWLFACAAVWVAWTFPLLQDHRHYFYGDTQNAYYGWFHHFGDALLHGRWPMLDVNAGAAGNGSHELLRCACRRNSHGQCQ